MNVLWLSNIRKADVEANDENVIWIYYDDTNNERKKQHGVERLPRMSCKHFRG